MKQRADFVIPECYIDTNLVETLVCQGGCNHQKGCNHVAKVMQEKYADRFAVGMIDADKRRPSYLAEFDLVASSPHIALYSHPRRSHFFILISPAADGFILDVAAGAGVNMADFGLADNMKDFIVQTKNVFSNRDARFSRLFRRLETTGEMALLKSLISYLADRTYRSDKHDIALLFESHQ